MHGPLSPLLNASIGGNGIAQPFLGVEAKLKAILFDVAHNHVVAGLLTVPHVRGQETRAQHICAGSGDPRTTVESNSHRRFRVSGSRQVPATRTGYESLGYAGDACRPCFLREIGQFSMIAGTIQPDVR
jgi:hypothetical protein